MIGNVVENKGFSTALILRLGSTIRFGHASAARGPESQQGKEILIHVEADESASDPWTSRGAGASNHVYPERACNDGE
jgi:hypothetical protein